MTRGRAGAVAGALLASLAAGCGIGGDDETEVRTHTERVITTQVEVVRPEGGPATAAFDAARVYRRDAPGVVTIVSAFEGGDEERDASPLGERGRGCESGAGVGTGFVVNARGEIATNAHVVTCGEGDELRRAKEVFVEFGDEAGNQVPAEIVGDDPNSDVALLRVNPTGLTLRPLRLGTSRDLVVGAPVAAIGSPFGEPRSLSVGIISAVDRTIDALNGFSIPGAVQTDAAINRGNSGGPLVNGSGEVIGVNAQIQSTGGGGEGVGYAVPVDLVRRALYQLRARGEVDYGYMGVSTVEVFPQLAERFDLPVDDGAWIQELPEDGPATDTDLRAGEDTEEFQARPYKVGGDVITQIDDTRLTSDADLSELVARRRPGSIVRLVVYRDGKRRVVRVRLAERPAQSSPGG